MSVSAQNIFSRRALLMETIQRILTNKEWVRGREKERERERDKEREREREKKRECGGF